MRNPWRALAPLMLLVLPFVGVAATSPTPQPPFVRVSPSSGLAGTQVTVSGGFFQPNQAVGLFFDNPSSTLGSAVPDDNGNINAPHVPIPSDARSGPHAVCAAVNAQQVPCAQFQVTAPPPTAQPTPPPTPQATPTPTPTDASSPTASPSASPSAISGVPTGSSGGGLLGSLFPWILIPILLLLAAGGTALYLILRNRGGSGGQASPFRPGGRPQPPGPPGMRPGQMTVTHRAPPPGGVGAPGTPPSGPPGGAPPAPPPPRPPAPPSGGWDDSGGPPHPGD
jgi:hypothetical protein